MKILIDKYFPEELIRLLQVVYWSIKLLLIIPQF